jgi:hypothetical protein
MRMEAKTSPHTESSFADGVDVGVGVDVFIPWNIKSVPFFTCTCVKCGHVVKGDTAVEARQAFEPHACPVVNAEASARRLFAYANLPQCERPAETPEGKIARLQRALSIMTDHALSRSVAANTFEKERNAARSELAKAKVEIGRAWNAHGEVKAICQEQAAGLMAALQAKGIAERERDALKADAEADSYETTCSPCGWKSGGLETMQMADEAFNKHINGCATWASLTADAELGALVRQMKPYQCLNFCGGSVHLSWQCQIPGLPACYCGTPEEALKAAFNQLIPTPERQG